ncbi:DUF4041 domain-containing protein [Rathayibacter sp. VKM Ac-2835]|uniref:DUF4041 domain-containing protein n=1 Tax=Rathayibacter sp. VKM Ac-2835 TaxID=2739043 RepID=UPI0020B7E17B|nr:DUF4041 domain-containing protein [Rathayibacter sp. VKM Ac-2835]
MEADRQEAAGELPTPVATAEARAEQLEAEIVTLRWRLRAFEDGSVAEASATSLAPATVPGTIELNDQQVLQEVGIYRYHHPLEDSAAYLPRLKDVEARSAALVREGHAIEKSNLFTFDNSLAKGRKMSDDLSKLMLRAYNAEAENSVRTLKLGNVHTAKKRLEASRAAIAKLGAMMAMHISDQYHGLRLEEIELTADWLMKKQEEKEEQREERARLREEARVEKELREQRAQLDKERTLLVQTIDQLRNAGVSDADLEVRLAAIDQAIIDNNYRAANIRAGFVYVISNRGAFGEGVVKIGLTRRLEPADRVHELGGASVPFRFDIHTIYFSEDAVTLETELHRHFAGRALNQANSRKEFFFATPAEVRDVLESKVGNLLEFRETADATEFFQSVGRWPSTQRPVAVLG